MAVEIKSERKKELNTDGTISIFTNTEEKVEFADYSKWIFDRKKNHYQWRKTVMATEEQMNDSKLPDTVKSIIKSKRFNDYVNFRKVFEANEKAKNEVAGHTQLLKELGEEPLDLTDEHIKQELIVEKENLIKSGAIAPEIEPVDAEKVADFSPHAQ